MNPRPAEQAAAEKLAQVILRENPQLGLPRRFRDLVAEQLIDGQTLHLDDLGEIGRFCTGIEVCGFQDRARLRSGDGDVVATCCEIFAAYEDYCHNWLGLGRVEWLRPIPFRDPAHVADACRQDHHIRRRLVDKVRHGELLALHPHMGSLAVWKLADELRRATGGPVKVIAPPPELSRWVNNKAAFADTVRRLFGDAAVPRTLSASNLPTVAAQVAELARDCRTIVLKLPNAVGGSGNLVLPADSFQRRPLAEVQSILAEHVQDIGWNGNTQLLVEVWEADVLSSPSAQLWIPPEAEGAPVVEGIFVQVTEGPQQEFTGTAPARFETELTRQIADRCWLLARLYQRLGYIGRCSFDMILIGKDLGNCRLELIECNGRWGGTSSPMTLMNRLFGDWSRQPFAVRMFRDIPGLDQITCEQLLARIGPDLFDVRTGRGSVIVYNPARMQFQSGIGVIALAADWNDAQRLLREEIPQRLQTSGE